MTRLRGEEIPNTRCAGFEGLAKMLGAVPGASVVGRASGVHEAIDGILGQDVLGRYITEVDVPRHKLVLHPPAATAWRTPELVAIPYTETLGLIRLAGALDGTPIAAILDLGAAATIANTRAAPGAAALPGASGVGADGAALAMAQVRGRALTIGDVAFGARDLYVSDLPVFADFGLAEQAAVILGMDVLASRRLVIDPGAKRVYIARG